MHQIAIIEPNTLASMGLRQLLEEIIPSVPVRTFSSFVALIDDTPDMYGHYFVNVQLFIEHPAFFLERRMRTIVLTAGGTLPQLAGFHTLDISQNEQALTRDILRLHQRGHAHHPHPTPPVVDEHDLTPREIEVLVLLTRGFINKEIADRLCISLTTVISHRKNITEKLGIKSLSGLTIYAVMRGYVEVDSI